jgi:hypothetical protein
MLKSSVGTSSRAIPWARVFAEGVVIVASILLALALDAWWDRLQENRRRADLAAALTQDFETTRARLRTSIAWGDSLIARSEAFLDLANSSSSIELDSMRFLAGGAFRAIVFNPALSSYRGAVATGELRLVRSSDLIGAFAEFDEALDLFELHFRISGDLYYLGTTLDLRQRLGSLSVLLDPPSEVPVPFTVSDAEYRALARERLVYSTVETVLIANRNMVQALQGADSAAVRVLQLLGTVGRD